jgi:hypothetical protein
MPKTAHAVAAWLSAMVIASSGALAQQPIRPVPMTPFGDGKHSVLMADLSYRIGETAFVIVVPAGFVTDFASVPRAFWALVPPFGRYQMAAIVHDFLYWDQGCTREQADALLRAAMAESMVDPSKRDVIWDAVRAFGGAAWSGNAAAKAAGEPRVIPKDDLAIPALVTWEDYRAQLVAKGVRPQPASASPPDYCAAAGTVKLEPPN